MKTNYILLFWNWYFK